VGVLRSYETFFSCPKSVTSYGKRNKKIFKNYRIFLGPCVISNNKRLIELPKLTLLCRKEILDAD
jgi:hypothetical protein